MFIAVLEKRIWFRRHFVELQCVGDKLVTRRGRPGPTMVEASESYADARSAIIHYERALAEHRRKGWTLVSGGEPVPPARSLEQIVTLCAVDAASWQQADFGNREISRFAPAAPERAPSIEFARNPQLEAKILAADEDADWRVYADWLASHGDELGSYINQCMDGVADAELIARLRPALLGEALLRFMHRHRDAAFGLQWRRGFIHRAWVNLPFDTPPELPDMVGALLDSPAARFMRELQLGMCETDDINTYDSVPPAFSERAPIESVESLFVGNYAYPEQTEISWTEVGDIHAILPCFPRLREFGVRGGQIELGEITHAQLEVLKLESGGLNSGAVQSVMRAELPRLRELELWLGDAGYGADVDVMDLRPLLAGRFANLEVLRLRNTELSNELVVALADSKVLPRLRVLDLSMGTLQGPGAAALLERADCFRHLAQLDLSDNFLVEEEQQQLRAALPSAIVDGQKQPYHYNNDEVHYFVSVGE